MSTTEENEPMTWVNCPALYCIKSLSVSIKDIPRYYCSKCGSLVSGPNPPKPKWVCFEYDSKLERTCFSKEYRNDPYDIEDKYDSNTLDLHRQLTQSEKDNYLDLIQKVKS